MDNLEKFINDRRSQFDDKKPPERLWHRIDKGLSSGGRHVPIYHHVWKAAAVILFAVVIWLLVDRQSQLEKISFSQIETTEGIAFKDVEDYYFSLIENKQQQIMLFVSQHPELDDRLINDIDRLDSSYAELKKKLVKGPDERIIDAMVVNLQTRIELLNHQLSVLERIKNFKDQTNETKNI